MSRIITQCPSCASLKLNVVKIECLQCATKFEGHFEIPDILKLDPEDLQLIIDFFKCSGSLKDMAAKQNVSYHILRNRINSLIATIEQMENNKNVGIDKINILKLLEEGKITTLEAAEMLKKI